MAENIFQRARRVVNATLEDGIERLERASGPKLMKQAVREVDYAIDDAQRAYNAASKRATIASMQSKSLQDEAKNWQGKAGFALSKGREELAEAALDAGLDCEARVRNLSAEEVQVKDEMEKLQANRKELEAKRARMQSELDDYVAAESKAKAKPSPGNDKKMSDIQESFERIMDMPVRTKTSDGNKQAVDLSDLDDLEKHDEIEDRLAALKKSMRAKKPK